MMGVDSVTGASGFRTIPDHELRAFWKVYQDHYDEVSEQSLEVLRDISEFAPFLDVVSEDESLAQQELSLRLLQEAIDDGAWEAYVENLIEQGSMYGQLGLSFSSWFLAVGSVRRILMPLFRHDYKGDETQIQDAVLGMDAFLDAAMSVIGHSYLLKKESTIRDQQDAIRELSTPVLPVRDGLLILPVVGVVDSHRAYQLTQSLLESIRRTRAKVVVIDITGVPSVDSKVANHFIQTVDAAKLMGTDAIMTGLSPAIAKALVTLGVDLAKLRTVGDLQGGLAMAEELLGYRIERSGKPR